MKYAKEIRKILRKILELPSKTRITVKTDLENIGMDSLKFIEAVVAIEDFFDIEFPEDKLLISEAGTLKKLYEIVASIKGEPDE